MSPRTSLVCFVLVTVGLGGYFGAPFLGKGNKLAHLPGATSHGHHQIEVACDQCHTPFGGVKNDACNKCHAESLTAANDSHPDGKFADPRNAERAAGLDARACVTCHREHAPERTVVGVSIAGDFCIKCHQDVLQERPSHKDFATDSCSNSGCHNFHDNRALYEDFLVKHLREPEELAVRQVLPLGWVPVAVPASAAPSVDAGAEPTDAGADAEAANEADAGAANEDAGAVATKQLSVKDHDAPSGAGDDAALNDAWAKSAHGKEGVNCTACHRPTNASSGDAKWQNKVEHTACAGCHQVEDAGFLQGLHGMRLASKLSPMTPELAQLPMKSAAGHATLGCNSCHKAHAFDTSSAAVDACVGCHDDQHTLAYKASRHFLLWEQERSGKAAKGTGVSCATCHLPREVHQENGRSKVLVQHNQNANLRPSDKMLRSVCMSCHGLGFSIDALADPDLVRRNFNGRSGRHVTSLDMAETRLKTKTGK